jgi:hypothetical protein
MKTFRKNNESFGEDLHFYSFNLEEVKHFRNEF